MPPQKGPDVQQTRGNPGCTWAGTGPPAGCGTWRSLCWRIFPFWKLWPAQVIPGSAGRGLSCCLFVGTLKFNPNLSVSGERLLGRESGASMAGQCGLCSCIPVTTEPAG